MNEILQRKYQLSKSIKRKRTELYHLNKNKSLTNGEVLKCSQELDVLILKYQKFYQNVKEKTSENGRITNKREA